MRFHQFNCIHSFLIISQQLKNKPVSQLKENFSWYARIPHLERKRAACQPRTLQGKMDVTGRGTREVDLGEPLGGGIGVTRGFRQKDLLTATFFFLLIFFNICMLLLQKKILKRYVNKIGIAVLELCPLLLFNKCLLDTDNAWD